MIWQQFYSFPKDPTGSYICSFCGKSFFLKDIPQATSMQEWLTDHLLYHLREYSQIIKTIDEIIPHGYSN